jgi:hypothetical protein
MRTPYRVDYQFICPQPCNFSNLNKTFVDAEDTAEARQLALSLISCAQCRTKPPQIFWHHITTQVAEATDADLES